MDNFKQGNARLRQTFHYPADDDADSTDSQPEAMDEQGKDKPPTQQQEDFIRRLAADNTARNASFARLLLALPMATALPYLPTLVRPATTVLSLLSLTSLLSTAFLLHRLSHTRTGIKLLDRVGSGRAPTEPNQLALDLGGSSPLEAYLPYLNLALVALLFLMGQVSKSDSASFGWLGMGTLPGIVYAVVLTAKMVMASVDPETELSGLKYQYKGA